MRRAKRHGAILAGCLLAWHAAAAAAADNRWTLAWSDEFAGTALDASKWDAILWTTPFNNERQAYLPQQVSVADGHLVLTAVDQPYAGKAYRSGKVESKYVQQYGRWEIRARLPGTLGTWPALWLLPDTQAFPWPSQGEIDILENRGHQPYLTSSAYHYGSSPANHRYTFAEQRTAEQGQLVNYHQDFHDYAVEWSPQQLRFFVDDVHYFTVFDEDVAGSLQKATAPMETVLNLAVGGDFLGSAQPGTASQWPQQLRVDHVRVYRNAENPPPRLLRNGGLEQRGGSLAGWTVFGNARASFPNVQTVADAALEGTASLKLTGQFSGAANYSGVTQGVSVRPGDRVEATASSLVRAAESLANSANELHLKIEFYRQFGGKYGSADMVGELVKPIASGASATDAWSSHALSAVAPADAVEARLALVFVQPGMQPGAVHVDRVRFRNLDLAPSADANGDGQVDGRDLLVWQRHQGALQESGPERGDFNYDGQTDHADFALWSGKLAASAAARVAAASVPEPHAAPWLLLAALRRRVPQRLRRRP